MSWEYQIKQFQYYLKIERSLSHNTQLAYVQDIEKVSRYLEQHFPGIGPAAVRLEHLRSFVNSLASLEISAYTQARIISGIKAFFKYLMYEDLIEEDPAALLQAPKL